MKTTMKKIVLGAAAAAMAMSAIGITASAAEKHPGESGCCYVNEYGKHPGESGFCYSDAEKTASESKQPGYLEAAENAVRAFIAEHPEYKIISTAAILGEGNCFYRVDAELKGVVHGPRMIFVVNDQICRKVDEKIYGKDGYSYEEEFNELGYNPSNYTDEQIKQIEAFRAENGFVSVTLLLKFDEENAAAQASAEKKPGEAGYNYFDGEGTNADGKHPGECGYNYVNEYGKHPGESGYCYDANQNTTNAYGKHPGESGYCYDANELGYDPSKYTEEQIRMIEASREVNGFVCGTLLIQFDEENAAKAKTEAKPQADENGKHPGESGYRYAENELGYDPSKYTEEQIRMIEASREVNGFVCGTLLMQFDEENAAKAKTEEKPQHATGLKVIGDVNCDGVVDVSDSVLLCRFLCEDADAVMTAQGRINADVNGDGKLTMDDNTALLDRIAKKE
ncbi:MAG: dockerin type I repeat-containing protein [Oscillospiraceae bacterium]|nr:dockerin type I repeat-containing protein [Oscillospiraceae bacterium]